MGLERNPLSRFSSWYFGLNILINSLKILEACRASYAASSFDPTATREIGVLLFKHLKSNLTNCPLSEPKLLAILIHAVVVDACYMLQVPQDSAGCQCYTMIILATMSLVRCWTKVSKWRNCLRISVSYARRLRQEMPCLTNESNCTQLETSAMEMSRSTSPSSAQFPGLEVEIRFKEANVIGPESMTLFISSPATNAVDPACIVL